ncbi:Maf family protein [Pusillimonas sp. 7-48]|uniref:Maf family protein n=1 Tax=Pusillimonas minor TaxID=2697024 RepID=A0A842HPU8_9BURK|nr:Maf family protein [Pusillimonas minor]
MFIAGISGSYSGVMGLPVFETAQLLKGKRPANPILSPLTLC